MPPKAPLYIGLMSGTSMDGVDAALVGFENGHFDLRATCHLSYPTALLQRLRELAANRGTPDDLGEADHWVAEIFATAVKTLLEQVGALASEVTAIGSHGQTIRHHPDSARPFTLQLGDPNWIAEHTGIPTVADFRRRDMAAGGEGAPLAPAFHWHAFGDSSTRRAIVNIGGIGNITLLPDREGRVIGFDTGPGNGLMDAWILRHRGQNFDRDGNWAGQGTLIPGLLEALKADAYFERRPPKSTGKEYFNLEWLEAQLGEWSQANPADVQRTLLELTAVSITDALNQHGQAEHVYICGGGAQNQKLMERLAELALPATIDSTAVIGLDPAWVEPVAFAWLAMRYMTGEPGNLPAVTGAKGYRILGSFFPGKLTSDFR